MRRGDENVSEGKKQEQVNTRERGGEGRGGGGGGPARKTHEAAGPPAVRR